VLALNTETPRHREQRSFLTQGRRDAGSFDRRRAVRGDLSARKYSKMKTQGLFRNKASLRFSFLNIFWLKGSRSERSKEEAQS